MGIAGGGLALRVNWWEFGSENPVKFSDFHPDEAEMVGYRRRAKTQTAIRRSETRVQIKCLEQILENLSEEATGKKSKA